MWPGGESDNLQPETLPATAEPNDGLHADDASALDNGLHDFGLAALLPHLDGAPARDEGIADKVCGSLSCDLLGAMTSWLAATKACGNPGLCDACAADLSAVGIRVGVDVDAGADAGTGLPTG